MTFRVLFALLYLIVCAQCSPKIKSTFAAPEHITYREAPRDIGERTGYCTDPLAFAHDPFVQRIPVQVSVHFMDNGPGTANLSPDEGRKFAHAVIEKCNHKLASNTKMFLPPGNETPVLPIPWYFVLTGDPAVPGDDGIYFHRDDSLFYYRHGKNTNRSSHEVLNKYAIRPDSVINIFMMPHHPDSVKSPTYKAVGTGIMLSKGVKVAQVFNPQLSPESCVGLLSHEIGHALGLSHTWGGNDGCDDTPKHDNCWYYTNEPPCDSLVSNNMMDYNAWQAALTPCQIGRVLRNVANLSSGVRKRIRPDWCLYDAAKTIVIVDSVNWIVPKDVAGDIYISDGATLQISCRLSLPEGGRIIVAPSGKLVLENCILQNTCSGEWAGVEVQTRGKESGAVEIIGDPRIENIRNAFVHVEDK